MRHKLLFPFFIFLIVALPIRSKDFVLTSGQTVVIACSPSEELVVRTALEMLGRDIQTVLSSTTQANEKTGEIVIGTVGQSELISRTGIDVSALKGKKQAFLLSVSPEGKLIVAGSDKHGTAYGILEISRLLGVSPWEWWADVTPEKKKLFKLSSKFQSLQAPSVEYRGIFINDEDWGLMPWSSRACNARMYTSFLPDQRQSGSCQEIWNLHRCFPLRTDGLQRCRRVETKRGRGL